MQPVIMSDANGLVALPPHRSPACVPDLSRDSLAASVTPARSTGRLFRFALAAWALIPSFVLELRTRFVETTE